MRGVVSLEIAALVSVLALAGCPSKGVSQTPCADAIAAECLPEAPQPASSVTAVEVTDGQSQPGQGQNSPQPAANPAATEGSAASSSSSAEAAGGQSSGEKSSHELAEEQLKAQEKQRVMGVMATFNTTRNRDAVPLSPGQKFRLFFRSSTDPWPFLLAGAVAGIGQADDSYPSWGQGAQGYGKRMGAAYSDAFIGNFFGNAVLPVVLHEDPRYYQMGTGNPMRRMLWAAGSTFICKRDRGGWGPNYANVGGNMIGAAIARVYYPASERSVMDVVNDGLTVSFEGIIGAEIIEFWPDLVRHYKQKKAQKRIAMQDAAQQPAPGKER